MQMGVWEIDLPCRNPHQNDNDEETMMRTKIEIEEVGSDVEATLALFAKGKALEAQAKAMIEDARAKVLALRVLTGCNQFAGAAGVALVSEVAGARRLDPKLARVLLTDEQVEACTVTGKPTIKIEFRPA